MNFRDSEYLIPVFDFDLLNLQLNTPVFIFFVFLVVLFALNRLLFQPVLRTLDERKTRLDTLDKETAAHREDVARLEASCHAKEQEHHQVVQTLKMDLQRETQAEIAHMLAEARKTNETQLSQAIKALDESIQREKESLFAQAEALGEAAASKIKGLSQGS